MDSVGKLVAIIIGVVLLFLAPIQSISQKQDSISQIVVDNETANFVDSIMYSGYISKEMYITFLKKLEKTGNIYKITLCHSRKQVTPGLSDESHVIQGEYDVHYINVYEDEIMESFNNGDDYTMNQGDYISVKVVNRNKTIGSKVMSALTFVNVDNKIITTYGGMIRDAVD